MCLCFLFFVCVDVRQGMFGSLYCVLRAVKNQDKMNYKTMLFVISFLHHDDKGIGEPVGEQYIFSFLTVTDLRERAQRLPDFF